MTFLALLLAQVPPPDTTLSWWWDVVQKIGIGGCFVLGPVCYVLVKAYQAKDAELRNIVEKKDAALAVEVTYSKESSKQMLVVVSELSTLIRNMESRDTKSSEDVKVGFQQLQGAISDLRNSIREYVHDKLKNAA
jgi:hypothetical protein